MHEDMQVSSKKTVSGAFYLRGSCLEGPMAILELLEFPKKVGNHAPRSSVHNSDFFGNSENFLRVTWCDRKIFAYFPKKIA